MHHSFDVDVANEVGIVAAILFQNIAYWCQHSKANGRNFHDGRYWTYNSVKAFCELFPYMTSKVIRNGLQKLIESDMVVTGNYNEHAYDRTMWYALSEKGESIFLKTQMDFSKKANTFAPEGEPIPNINTDISADINTNKDMVRFDDFWSVYPNKVKKKDARIAWKSSKLDNIADTIIADVKQRCATQWKGKELKYVPHPTSYLHQRRWEDETRTDAPIEQPRVYEEPDYENNW